MTRIELKQTRIRQLWGFLLFGETVLLASTNKPKLLQYPRLFQLNPRRPREAVGVCRPMREAVGVCLPTVKQSGVESLVVAGTTLTFALAPQSLGFQTRLDRGPVRPGFPTWAGHGQRTSEQAHEPLLGVLSVTELASERARYHARVAVGIDSAAELFQQARALIL